MINFNYLFLSSTRDARETHKDDDITASDIANNSHSLLSKSGKVNSKRDIIYEEKLVNCYIDNLVP